VVPEVEYRRLTREEFALVRDIDRTERIEGLYVQHGATLELRPGGFNAPAWHAEGIGAHSVAAHQAAVEEYVDAGAVALGAFDGERLVAIGLVLPHIRRGMAQLAYLHVSNGYRARRIGSRLCDELEEIARRAGDTEIVVSGMPSVNTVRFYQGRGYRPMAEPLPELLELEPEDVHLSKPL